MSKAKPELVVFVEVEDSYGQTRLKARIGRTLPDADEYGIPFARCNWSIGGFDPGAEFDGFEASAYVGYSAGLGDQNTERGIWGLHMAYADVRIEHASQAMRIARAFTRIEKGMTELNNKEGYLRDDSDFAGYVVRLARVLKIEKIYTRNRREAAEMTGERYALVNGSSLQYYCAAVADARTNGRIHEYVR